MTSQRFSVLRFICMVVLILMFGLTLGFAQSTSGSVPICNLSFQTSVTATTQLVAAPPTNSTTINVNGVPTTTTINSKRIHICNVNIFVNQAAGAANYGLTYGTGAACVTGETSLTPQWIGTASVKERYQEAFGAHAALVAPVGKAVCLKLSATPTNAQVLISYAIF